MMFHVLFDGRYPPLHSKSSYDTFNGARDYVRGWLSNMKQSIPDGWTGAPIEFALGSTIEIVER